MVLQLVVMPNLWNRLKDIDADLDTSKFACPGTRVVMAAEHVCKVSIGIHATYILAFEAVKLIEIDFTGLNDHGDFLVSNQVVLS